MCFPVEMKRWKETKRMCFNLEIDDSEEERKEKNRGMPVFYIRKWKEEKTGDMHLREKRRGKRKTKTLSMLCKTVNCVLDLEIGGRRKEERKQNSEKRQDEEKFACKMRKRDPIVPISAFACINYVTLENAVGCVFTWRKTKERSQVLSVERRQNQGSIPKGMWRDNARIEYHCLKAKQSIKERIKSSPLSREATKSRKHPKRDVTR